MLLKQNAVKHAKICDSICSKFDLPIENFPYLIVIKKQSSVNWSLNKYLKEKTDTPEFRGLDRVVETFDGLTDMLCYVCAALYTAKRRHEAKGVFMRHKLTPEDFVKAYEAVPKKAGNNAHLGKELAQMKYDPAADWKPMQDLFEPVSVPSHEYLRLPPEVNMLFINDEQ